MLIAGLFLFTFIRLRKTPRKFSQETVLLLSCSIGTNLFL